MQGPMKSATSLWPSLVASSMASITTSLVTAGDHSRPEIDVIARLKRPDLKPHLLDARSAENLADLRHFLRSELENLAFSLGLSHKVKFLGRRSDIHQLLQQMRAEDENVSHLIDLAIKLEGLAKSAYLSLVEAAPLSVQGKALGARVTADADRWQHPPSEE